MAIRVSEQYHVMSILWSILGSLQLVTTNLRGPIPFFLAIGLIASGAFFGIGCGDLFARRQLLFLEKKGEVRWSLTKTLYLVGGIFIVVAAFVFLYFFVSSTVYVIMIDFFAPFIPASFAVESTLFRNWERKHKKTILAGTWVNRLYVYP